MPAFDRLSRRTFAGTSVAALAACAHGGLGSDEFIIHGGPIYTGREAAAPVEAVRVRAGRFVGVGALADLRSAGVRMIDLGGAAALPGLVDAHCHLTGVGMATLRLDLVGTPSIAAMLASVRAYAAVHAQGPIVGRGWIETHWPEHRFPTAADLDSVVSDRPVYLQRIDGHAGVANSAALALAGITNDTPNPDGGRIERDPSGAATGMLIDNAKALVEDRLPPPTEAMRREALAQAMRLYASRGWTGAANMSSTLEELSFFGEFESQHALPIQVSLYLQPEDAVRYFDGARRQGFDRAQVRGVKLYADGALGSRGAALLAPYSDSPGDGLLVTQPEALRAAMARAKQYGYQVATHAIGDRGNRITLDAYQATFASDPAALRAGRWRVEHAQVLSPQDIPRFGQMGVIASMQASHAISDLYFAPARLGSERLAGAYAWRSLLDSGAVICGGSDAPVERGDPLVEFYAASFRHSLEGFAGADWHLEQTMTRAQALRALTWAPAFASHQEQERGTIEVGKRADISVFSVDLMQAPFAQIPTAHALLAVSDGVITHNAL